jgi:hypothetical protein
MKVKTSFVVVMLSLVLTASIAQGKDKKKPPQRGMLESMQAVPCGAKERGVTGLGSVFASVGVEHVISHGQKGGVLGVQRPDVILHFVGTEQVLGA